MDVSKPRPVPLTGSRSRAGARRRLGHRLAGVVGSAALAALWVWQLAAYVPANWLSAVGLILALVAGWVCLSLAWVAWCRSIYRRRHRRVTPLRREVGFAHDALGRRS